LDELDQQGLIERSSTGNPRKIIFADDAADRGKRLCDIWEFKDPQYPVYPTEKNTELLKTIIRTSSHPGQTVLDCFCGSGTTLLAAGELDRHWIGIDQSDIAIDVVKKNPSGRPGDVVCSGTGLRLHGESSDKMKYRKRKKGLMGAGGPPNTDYRRFTE